MQRALAIAFLTLCASTAHADLSARLRMIARGALSVDPVRVTARIPGGAATLTKLGFSARPLSPSVAALEVDRAGLLRLAQTAARVEEQRRVRPTLDRASTIINATAARASSGLTGAGVIVGVVDTGADFRHGDLRNADGTSRIEALLDLSAPEDSRHASLGSFGGAIWTRDEIDAQLTADDGGAIPAAPVTELDDIGHGTHVTSIAASDGLATGRGLPDGRYVGIAPEARIVVAQARDSNGDFTDANVIAACNFLVAEQGVLGLPMVVNLSLGVEGGPHDGSTNFEIALDELFPTDNAGRALVVAAGNDGAADLHAGGWALDGTLDVPFDVEDTSGMTLIELWPRDAIDVAIQSPDGERTPFFSSTAGNSAMLENVGVVIEVEQTDKPGVSIVLTQPSGHGAPPIGDYKLILRGTTLRWDAWLVEGDTLFTGQLDESERATAPSTATSAISVGAMVSRLDWPTIDLGDYSLPGTDPTFTGGPASFSGTGPTSDGRFSPDVAAPGEFVVAALSRDAPPTLPQSVFYVSDPSLPSDAYIADDGVHAVLAGTSMASPMVTGTVALLFEADPTLTVPTLRELLRSTAAPIPGTSGWSGHTGFGTIDVAAAIALLRGTRGATVDATQTRVGITRDLLPPDSDETTLVSVTPRDASGVALGPGHTVTIDLLGNSVANLGLGDVRDVGAGRYERSFVAHAAEGTSGTVQASVDGTAIATQPVVWFARSRVDIGGSFTAGGGCSFADHGGGRANLIACLIMLLLCGQLVARRRV